MNSFKGRLILAFLACAAVVIAFQVGSSRNILQIAFASEMTLIFDDVRTMSFATDEPTKIAEYLSCVVNYYPSGTKIDTGTAMDRIVERHRASIIREIIARLRSLTNLNLGDQPEPWIAKWRKP